MRTQCLVFFFFSSRRRHTRCYRDWSSDVCSSDLAERDTSGFRTLEFKDAAHYRELHEAQRQALGFGGSVRNRRDRLDLERIGLVGVQKPATGAPTKLLDRSTGRAGTQ